MSAHPLLGSDLRLLYPTGNEEFTQASEPCPVHLLTASLPWVPLLLSPGDLALTFHHQAAWTKAFVPPSFVGAFSLSLAFTYTLISLGPQPPLWSGRVGASPLTLAYFALLRIFKYWVFFFFIKLYYLLLSNTY